MKKSFYPLTVLLLAIGFLPKMAIGQCTTWSSPAPPATYNDFNQIFLGAPCDNGAGCPNNVITSFEVYASEAYICNNFQAGGTYQFNICDGPNAHAWVPEFTILAPSGTVVAFGPGDGDSCTITWTATEAGAYRIIINEAGYCPGGPHTTSPNGNPALTCLSGATCTGLVCGAGILETTGMVNACGPNATFGIGTDGTEFLPPNGGHGWFFSDQLGGTGGQAGGFILTNTLSNGTYNADLNGVLSGNFLQPLVGKWVVKSVTYVQSGNPSNTVCSTSTDSLIVSFSPNLPPLVSVMDNGNSSATVTATGGTTPYSYLWSNGQTLATATGLPTGEYDVIVTDANGCTVADSVGVVSGVSEASGHGVFDILPNPTKGLFSVKMLSGSTQNLSITVLDVTGRVVAEQQGKAAEGSFNFNLSGQQAGVYLVRITLGSNSFARRLVLIQ